MRKDAPKPQPYDDVFGDGQLDDVILVDQSPIGRSPRSNPVTYIKAFDEIRAVFRRHGRSPHAQLRRRHFSFNVDGGRCSACEGDGYIAIDMQFLADVYMKCSQCGGTRYRKEILDVKYRGRNIAEVLEMTVREAFTFFRGQTKVQARLKRLIDVGLDYLRLGQPANTLSGGEAQRLKLAAYMSATRRGRSLFILDEPTTGLHFQDVVQLVDCFEALLNVGHSLIVVEHNLQLMKAADYIIDLGPGAADEGGRVVAQGTPEAVARVKESVTGRFLAKALAEERKRAGEPLIAVGRGRIAPRGRPLSTLPSDWRFFSAKLPTRSRGSTPGCAARRAGARLDAWRHVLTGLNVHYAQTLAGPTSLRRSRRGSVAAGRGDRAGTLLLDSGNAASVPCRDDWLEASGRDDSPRASVRWAFARWEPPAAI